METGVPTFNTIARTNLEFPLSWHNLGVGTGDLDTGIQTSLVMSLDDISAENLASTNTTIVWTLRTWEAIYWPSVRSVRHIKESIFLLQTEPWLMGLVGLHEFGSLMTVVELVWGSIGIPALSQDQDIWGTTEWIWEDCNGAEVNIRVVTGGLTSWATVEVPFWEIIKSELTALWDLGKSLRIKVMLVHDSFEIYIFFNFFGWGLSRGAMPRYIGDFSYLWLGTSTTSCIDPDVPF